MVQGERIFSNSLASSLALVLLMIIAQLTVTGCSSESETSYLPKGPPIRIEVESLQEERLNYAVEFEVQGAVQIYSVSEKPILIRALEEPKVKIQVVGGKILLNDKEEPFTENPFRILSTEQPLVKMRVLPPSEDDSVNFKEYRGTLDVFFYGSQLRVINELNLEEYLAGVLGNEMGGDGFPLEALKAQAIAARTFTLYNMRRDFDPNGEISPDLAYKSSMEFQSYGGMTKENDRILQAVRETSGLVLTYDGSLFQTYYHSNCGGATASGHFFGEQEIAPLKGVTCDYCKDSPGYSWDRTFSKQDLEGVLVAWAGAQGLKIGKLVLLKPVDAYPSQHHAYLRIVHTEGAFEMRIDRFRKLIGRHFGANNIPSGRFDVKKNEDGKTLTFTGKGYGHGVGLCQYGAAKFGESATCGKILAHYFPEAGQKKLY